MASLQNYPDSILVKTPFLSTEEAAELFSRLYGTSKPVLVKTLVGYYSQNFYLQLKEEEPLLPGGSITNVCGVATIGGVVLKVLNTEASRNVDVFRTIHSIQRYLNGHGYMCAAPLLNIHGDDMKVEEFTRINSLGQREHGFFMVRAYPYITGTTLDEVEPANATQIFHEAGRKLAEMHQMLEKYPHDVQALVKRLETYELNPLRTDIIRSKVDAVKDDDRRCLVIDVLNAVDSQIYPNVDKLRIGILHGDFSHTNLVLSEDNNSTIETPFKTTAERGQGHYKLCGLLDFDECHYNCLAFDVGTAMAYISMSKAAGDRPLHFSAVFLAGYQSINPLTPEELKVLHICQASRFVLSFVLGLYYHILQPDNDYLLKSQTCWSILQQLWKMDVAQMHKMWRDVAAECVKFEHIIT